MKRMWIAGLAIFCLALPALAQEAPPRDGPERAGPREGRGRRGMSPQRMMRRLARDLELDDAQRQQFDEIVARHREEWARNRPPREEVREMMRAHREAVESGDTEQVEQIRAQMREMRGQGPGPMLDEFINEVEAILTEDQLPKLNEFREQMESRRRGAESFRLMHELPERLNLTPEQRTQWEELMAEQREQFGQQRGWRREMRPLMEEMRAAEEAGDEQRVAEIRAQLEEARPEPPDFDSFFDKLMPILTDEQKAQLTELRGQVGQSRQQRGRVMDVREIFRVVRRLDLTEEQRDRLREIMRDAKAITQKSRGGGREAKTEQAELIKSQIIEMLDADQKAEFERLLDQAGRPNRNREPRREGRDRRGDSNRGERRGRNR